MRVGCGQEESESDAAATLEQLLKRETAKGLLAEGGTPTEAEIERAAQDPSVLSARPRTRL